jgi:hypothetical protein
MKEVNFMNNKLIKQMQLFYHMSFKEYITLFDVSNVTKTELNDYNYSIEYFMKKKRIITDTISTILDNESIERNETHIKKQLHEHKISKEIEGYNQYLDLKEPTYSDYIINYKDFIENFYIELIAYIRNFKTDIKDFESSLEILKKYNFDINFYELHIFYFLNGINDYGILFDCLREIHMQKRNIKLEKDNDALKTERCTGTPDNLLKLVEELIEKKLIEEKLNVEELIEKKLNEEKLNEEKLNEEKLNEEKLKGQTGNSRDNIYDTKELWIKLLYHTKGKSSTGKVNNIEYKNKSISHQTIGKRLMQMKPYLKKYISAEKMDVYDSLKSWTKLFNYFEKNKSDFDATWHDYQKGKKK